MDVRGPAAPDTQPDPIVLSALSSDLIAKMVSDDDGDGHCRRAAPPTSVPIPRPAATFRCIPVPEYGYFRVFIRGECITVCRVA
jgi:hypothetical protein